MQGWLPRDIWSDARHYQIAALSTLVIYNFGWLDFGARPLNSASRSPARSSTQIVCSRLYGLPSIDLRSPLITGLSLSLLLARRRALAACGRGRDRHRLEIRAAHRRQAHLESGRPCHRGAAVHLERRLDLARAMGLGGLVRRAPELLRDPGAARRAPLRHGAVLPRQPCGAAARARLVARRPARDPDSSAAERLAADLRVLHDLRSAHLARFTPRPLPLRGVGGAPCATTSPSSCRCGRRFTSR